jgi:glutathione peroxidase
MRGFPVRKPCHPIARIHGKQVTLAEYHGSVLLIVNMASARGFTPQYASLESLYWKYHVRSFVALGFPCGDFGGQEPGDASTDPNISR